MTNWKKSQLKWFDSVWLYIACWIQRIKTAYKFSCLHPHTCHKLWAEICEIRQIFKWDLIKFCQIFTKITLKLPQNSQKHLFKCKKLVINTKKCDLCLFLHKMCCKMVWTFCETWKSYGNWLPDGPNSVRFISHCQIWHVCILSCSVNILTVFRFGCNRQGSPAWLTQACSILCSHPKLIILALIQPLDCVFCIGTRKVIGCLPAVAARFLVLNDVSLDLLAAIRLWFIPAQCDRGLVNVVGLHIAGGIWRCWRKIISIQT